MTSLFTLFVARGSEVPAVDPRLIAHVDALAVVTQDDRQAAPAEGSNDVEAPAPQISSTPVQHLADESTASTT